MKFSLYKNWTQCCHISFSFQIYTDRISKRTTKLLSYLCPNIYNKLIHGKAFIFTKTWGNKRNLSISFSSSTDQNCHQQQQLNFQCGSLMSSLKEKNSLNTFDEMKNKLEKGIEGDLACRRKVLMATVDLSQSFQVEKPCKSFSLDFKGTFNFSEFLHWFLLKDILNNIYFNLNSKISQCSNINNVKL